MTTADAAKALGYKDPSRVRQLVRSGLLAAEKEDTPRGPILWFDQAELDRFKEWRSSQPPPKGRKGRPYGGLPEGTPGSEDVS